MKNKKLITSLITTAALLSPVCCTALPMQTLQNFAITASADDFTYQDFTYTVNDTETITITGYTGTGGSVTIPSEIEGKPVTCIGDWALGGNNNLTDIVIPSSVTTIRYAAFINNPTLRSVSILGNVTEISDYAFEYCYALSDITLPDSITSIGFDAFGFCTSLNHVVLPNSVTNIRGSAFESCESLTDITLSQNLSSISSAMFNKCTNLESIIIPASVNNIDNYAFINCYKLKDITILNPSCQFYNYITEYTGVENIYGYIGSTAQALAEANNLNFIALEEAQITAQPQNASGVIGDTLTFTVSATGTDLKYQWQYYDVKNSAWKNTGLTGNKTNALRVPVIEGRNQLQYRCVITDQYDNTVISDTATVTVLTKITAQPKNASGVIGETVKFSVTATGAGLKYQWQYYDTQTSTWKNTGLSGNQTSTLSVIVKDTRNNLKYRCRITDANNAKVNSNSAKVTVLSQITKQPQDASGVVGDTLKYTVAATGAGLSYQWQYYDVKTSTWKSTGLTGCKTDTLSVPVTAARNNLKYRCAITDANSAVIYSNTVKVTVLSQITKQPQDGSGYIGDTLKYSVTATGAGLKYQWQYYDTKTSTWKNTGLSGNATATLSVIVKETRNNLKYRCKITDANNAVTYSNTVKVIVLSQITEQPQNASGYIGETLKYSVVATGAGLKYQWQYYDTQTSSWKNTGLSGCKTDTLSVIAKETRNNLRYRCKITDANSAVIYSTTVKVTVLSQITEQPKNITAALNTTVQFTVTATGAGLKYQWQYYDTKTSTWKNTGLTGNTTDTLSVKATKERNGLKYRCKITDANSAQLFSDAAKLTVK